MNTNNIKFSLSNNCGYFIAKLLGDLKISSKLTSWKFWTIHSNIIKLCDNVIYSIPIQLIYDNLLINNIDHIKLINYC